MLQQSNSKDVCTGFALICGTQLITSKRLQVSSGRSYIIRPVLFNFYIQAKFPPNVRQRRPRPSTDGLQRDLRCSGLS